MKDQGVLQESRRSRSRLSVSAIAVLLISSTVVLLSIVVLFIYVNGIYERQNELEDDLQASLSEISAVEALRHDFLNMGVPDLSDLPEYELAGNRTVFELLSVSSSPSETFGYGTEGRRILEVVPAGSSLFVLSEGEEGYVVDFIPEATGSDVDVQVFPLPVEGASDLDIASARLDSGPALFVLIDGDRDILISIMPFRSPSMEVTPFDSFFESDGILSAGSYAGEPAIILSDGFNRGRLFLPSSDSLVHVSSQPGTVPYLFGGELYGLTGTPAPPDTTMRVSEVIEADFDSDGIDDLLFVGPGSIGLFSSGKAGVAVEALSGARLAAWGFMDASGMLSARWISHDGRERWRSALNGVFVESPGPEFLPYPWEGRLEYSRQTMVGGIGAETVLISDYGGEPEKVGDAGSTVLCQLDGYGSDLVSFNDDSLTVFLNLLEGNGLVLQVRSYTLDSTGDLACESTWNYWIYGIESSRRVYFEGQG